jgi:hypothetical protein
MSEKLLDIPLGINPNQELLLKAAVFPPDRALGYWKQWKKENKIADSDVSRQDILPQIFDPLDHDSQRLLALIYWNLEKSGDPIISTLRGYYRYSWMKGSYFISNAATLVSKLQAAGFDVMLLKGLPLAILYYKNIGVRPMEDIDIFVPLHQVEDVIRFIEENVGIKANEKENELRKLGMFHAMHFSDGKGLDFDLHWHFHIYHLNAKADQPMWDKKIPLAVTSDVTSATLSPTHQLYRNFTHGYSWLIPNPPIRWIPDSLIILNTSADLIDWTELFELARRQKLIIPVCSMLRYLHEHFNVHYPPSVVASLNILQGSRAERYYFKLLVKAGKRNGSEWLNFVNKTSRILLRYHLYEERDVNNSFPVWLVKRIRYTLISRNTEV